MSYIITNVTQTTLNLGNITLRGGSSASVSELTNEMVSASNLGVLNINPPVGSGGGTLSDADFDEGFGTPEDVAPAPWYTSVKSHLGLLRLLIATTVGAGSHVYTYTDGQLTSDAWTLFGVTRTKTFTYENGSLVGESDWV